LWAGWSGRHRRTARHQPGDQWRQRCTCTTARQIRGRGRRRGTAGCCRRCAGLAGTCTERTERRTARWWAGWSGRHRRTAGRWLDVHHLTCRCTTARLTRVLRRRRGTAGGYHKCVGRAGTCRPRTEHRRQRFAGRRIRPQQRRKKTRLAACSRLEFACTHRTALERLVQRPRLGMVLMSGSAMRTACIGRLGMLASCIRAQGKRRNSGRRCCQQYGLLASPGTFR